MSNSPKYYAFTIKDRGNDKKAIWTRIGVVWAQKGQGLTLQLEAYPVGGKILLLPPKANEAASDTFEGEAAQ